MTAVTPFAEQINELPPLASRYVNVEDLPWRPTGYEGIDIKVLLEEPETGLMTALFRWAPGSSLPLHEHVEIEQTYMISGSIADEQGETTAGNFSWRPKGNVHRAWSPNGALLLAVFLKPNRFLEGPNAGGELR